MKNDHKKGSTLAVATEFLSQTSNWQDTQIATAQALAKRCKITVGSARFLVWRWTREKTLSKLVRAKSGAAHKAYVGINITRKFGKGRKPKAKAKARKRKAKAEATIPVSVPA